MVADGLYEGTVLLGFIVTVSVFIGVIKDECWLRLRHFVNQVYILYVFEGFVSVNFLMRIFDRK